MASDQPHNDASKAQEEAELKHLNIVYVVALKTMELVGFLYEFAKENSGTLRPGVENVEGTVRTVLGPLYHKVGRKPLELLISLDQKIDESYSSLGDWLSQYGKDKLDQTYSAFQRFPDFVFSLVTDIQKDGVYETAKVYYVKYEPIAEDISYNAWKNLLKLPVVPDVVNVIAPPTIFGASKLNDVIGLLKETDVPFASYIPLLPIEKMERAVRLQED